MEKIIALSAQLETMVFVVLCIFIIKLIFNNMLNYGEFLKYSRVLKKCNFRIFKKIWCWTFCCQSSRVLASCKLHFIVISNIYWNPKYVSQNSNIFIVKQKICINSNHWVSRQDKILKLRTKIEQWNTGFQKSYFSYSTNIKGAVSEAKSVPNI